MRRTGCAHREISSKPNSGHSLPYGRLSLCLWVSPRRFKREPTPPGWWRAVAQQTSGKWQDRGSARNRDYSDTGVKAKHLGFTLSEAA